MRGEQEVCNTLLPTFKKEVVKTVLKIFPFRNVALAGLLLVTSLLLSLLLLRLGLKVEITYNEGWNAYHALRAASGESLYQDNLTPNNYPPLSFYIIGFISKFIRDPILTGRAISLLSLLFIAFSVEYIVQLITRHKFEAVFAGIFCLAVFTALAMSYVGMDDPQLLGQAFMLAGLIVYLKKIKASLPLVALLFSIGLFIKHNLITLLVVVSIDIFFSSRKDFFKWISYLFFFLGGFTFVTEIASHGTFIQLILLKRQYSLYYMVLNLKYYISLIVIPFLIALCYVLYRAKSYRLFCLYFLLSFLIGVLFSGGDGTGVNMFFDLYICLAIVFGLLLSELHTRSLSENTLLTLKWRDFSYGFRIRSDFSKLYLVALFLLVAHIYMILGVGYVAHLVDYSALTKQEATVQDVEYLEGEHGATLCENLVLCFYAHKPFSYDPFNVDEEVLTGRITEGTILTIIENKYFSIIQLDKPVPTSYFTGLPYTSLIQRGIFTENFLRALGKNYHLVHLSDNGAFYAPNK